MYNNDLADVVSESTTNLTTNLKLHRYGKMRIITLFSQQATLNANAEATLATLSAGDKPTYDVANCCSAINSSDSFKQETCALQIEHISGSVMLTKGNPNQTLSYIKGTLVYFVE